MNSFLAGFLNLTQLCADALLGVVVCFAKKQHCYYKPEHIQPSQPLGNVGGGGAHGVAAPSASQKSPIGAAL